MRWTCHYMAKPEEEAEADLDAVREAVEEAGGYWAFVEGLGGVGGCPAVPRRPAPARPL